MAHSRELVEAFVRLSLEYAERARHIMQRLGDYAQPCGVKDEALSGASELETLINRMYDAALVAGFTRDEIMPRESLPTLDSDYYGAWRLAHDEVLAGAQRPYLQPETPPE